MTSLVALIVDVHDHLRDAGLPHAFGGALALGYIAEPRGTVDIDVNVFVPVEEIGRVEDALRGLDYRLASGAGDPPVAGHRFEHASEPFPLDVFCDLDDRYDAVAQRVVNHPFGPEAVLLPFLSAEDLCVFKLSVGRAQDWVDLEKIAVARRSLDVDYVEDQLIGLRGPTMHRRLTRFRRLLTA